jgi:hypothetical protein
MTTLSTMFELGLHLVALGGLAHISLLIHSGSLIEALVTSFATALCILVVAWAMVIAKAWFSD